MELHDFKVQQLQRQAALEAQMCKQSSQLQTLRQKFSKEKQIAISRVLFNPFLDCKTMLRPFF